MRNQVRKQSVSNFRAVIDGYIMIPVYSYIPFSAFDDINVSGCNYLYQAANYLGYDPKYYVSESNYIIPRVGYRLAEAYNWSPKAV